ncbi:hypothetical protein V502_09066 [Pseudogymnoascus sp. VKM F-4520 (FW-2644)]|nr:hypothetical protein V502_09066 [Pseudogymnoascus sp. VKM F-4520 (FW-2644)]
MSGDYRYRKWRQHEPRSPHGPGSSFRDRGGGRGQHRGRGRGSYNEDRDQEDRDERQREQRAAAAEAYRNTNDRGQHSEYRDRNKGMYNLLLEDHFSDLNVLRLWLTSFIDNANSWSRDSSEHGSRQLLSNPQDSTPSTPTGCGLGAEFASAIQSLAEWSQEKQLLRLKHERARQACEEAKFIYEAGKPTHSQFPIEAERAKERYAKEKSALEVLEAKLKDANAKISTTKAAVAQHYDSLTSSKGGVRSSRPGIELEEGSLEAENRQLKENLAKLEWDVKSEIRRLNTELDLRIKGAEDRMTSDSRDQVAALNSTLLSKTESLVTLSRDVLDLKKNSDYHKNQLVQQQDQLREHKNSIKKLGGTPFKGHSDHAPSGGDERALLRIQSVETQLAAEHSSNLKLASRIETVEQAQTSNMSTMQEKIKLAVANTSSLELVPRIDAIESAQATMLKIQENFEQVQRNVVEFDDDLGGLDQRIKALESSSHGPRSSNATGPENNITSAAPHGTSATNSITQRIDALENSINSAIMEIKESQEASDMAHGAVGQGLNERVLKLETGVPELMKDVESLETNQSVASVEQLQRSVRDLRSAFASLKSDEATRSTTGGVNRLIANIETLEAQQRTMSDEHRHLLRRIGSLEADFVSLNPVRALISPENAASTSPTGSLQNGVSKATLDWPPILDALRNQVSEIHSKLAETKKFEAGVNMGIRSLDTRMNNIYTDHLCKQIIGQLQTVYPNLARVESHLADFKARIGHLESTFHNHTESIGYIKDGQDAIQGRQKTWESKTATAIATLSAAIEKARASISDLQRKDDISENPAGTNGQDDTSLKKEVAERIDSLSISLKEQIDAASKHLQEQIEGIEHLIEFDEDGKVESVKEVIHVLTENYGKLMGEFDALEVQVQRLKTEAASNRAASASRSDSAALASGMPSRAKQSGNKRSAPSSPSTGPQVPSQQQANKRRRGPFIEDSEDDKEGGSS